VVGRALAKFADWPNAKKPKSEPRRQRKTLPHKANWRPLLGIAGLDQQAAEDYSNRQCIAWPTRHLLLQN
jgi:hypothetical protein